MRTTIDLNDQQVISAVREISESSGEDLGTTVTNLIRRGRKGTRKKLDLVFDEKLGINTLPYSQNNSPLSLDQINRLRDDEE